LVTPGRRPLRRPRHRRCHPCGPLPLSSSEAHFDERADDGWFRRSYLRAVSQSSLHLVESRPSTWNPLSRTQRLIRVGAGTPPRCRRVEWFSALSHRPSARAARPRRWSRPSWPAVSGRPAMASRALRCR
jgi:hypothetical protein